MLSRSLLVSALSFLEAPSTDCSIAVGRAAGRGRSAKTVIAVGMCA